MRLCSWIFAKIFVALQYIHKQILRPADLVRLGSVFLLFRSGGGVGVWEEKWRLKLTSVKVEVEVEAELGNID